MKYKGYVGTVEPDEDAKVLFGRVIGLRDVITFQGETMSELVQAFHDSVDDYLAFCAQRGERPDKPYSGQFVLRLPPELHRELANAAEAQATSLNALVEATLKSAFLSSDQKRLRSERVGTRRAPTTKKPLSPAKKKGAQKATAD